MPRRDKAQLNICTAFARARVHEIARRTGMTATEVIEDASRGYVPAGEPKQVGALVRRGPLLVLPASGRRQVSLSGLEGLRVVAKLAGPTASPQRCLIRRDNVSPE